ncbi:effector-associated domain 2-containing protein [Actinomadura rifamycini]|uniref:VMAP-C domain-containing protein n=1 Tax=Actinomadura rifamycini TaxID=31962 RepID=UPI00047EB0E1|nr:hypothetical protein [Actinomadura rifamycini]
MQRQRIRDQYLAHLRKELGVPLPVRRDERDFFDLQCLVEGCLDHPGALHAFLRVIERFHSGSSTFAEVMRLASAMLPEPLLEPGERRALHELVKVLQDRSPDVLHPGTVRELFWTVVDPVGSLDIDPGDIWPVLDDLEDRTVDADGVPRLLDFVERLAFRTGEPMRKALRRWTEQAAERLGVADVVLQRRETLADGPEPPRMYLVIAFRPDGVSPDKYLVSAWLQSDDGHGVTLRCQDDHPIPVAQLPALVVELLTEEEQVVNRPALAELAIEFVLPLNLLGTASLDQLRITVDGLERRLGIEHPVVVRSLDRMMKPNYHPAWRRKWKWMREHPHDAKVCSVTQPGEYRGESLYNMLLANSSFVCLALAFPPRTDGAGAPDELRIGLQAGAPVIAWCRDGLAPDMFAEGFHELVSRGVPALPDSVLALRREAVAVRDRDPGADHLGFQLTLLFDDADRFPEPRGRLRAPA